MNYVVAIPSDTKLAEFIGKKGSEDSIVFYDRKIGDDVIVTLIPGNLQEKFYALAEALLVSRQIIISTASIDKLLGEALVAASLLDRRLILTEDNEVGKFLEGAGITKFEVIPKEALVEGIMKYKENDSSGDIRIDLDKAFPVKGVGCVALGIITRGTVKVHDNLYHTSGKMVTIRSIQSQDVDVQESGMGTRVGVALKGIEDEEINKGDLLTKNQIPRRSMLKINIRMSTASKEDVLNGNIYMFVSNFSYANATVDSVSGSEVTIRLEKPLAVDNGDEFLLIREKTPRIFAAGKIVG